MSDLKATVQRHHTGGTCSRCTQTRASSIGVEVNGAPASICFACVTELHKKVRIASQPKGSRK